MKNVLTSTEIRFCDRCMMKRIHNIIEEEDGFIHTSERSSIVAKRVDVVVSKEV